MKKNSKVVISLFIIISLIVSSSLAAIAAPVTSSDGHLTIDKTAEVVDEQSRTYQVELSVTGTPPEPKPLDVILVIDGSGSMADSYNERTLMSYAREAARNFAAQVLEASEENRVAVFEFFGPPYLEDLGGLYNDSNLLTVWNNRGKTYAGFTSSMKVVTKAINSAKVGWGTNIQAGFRRAENLILGEDNEYSSYNYRYARTNAEKIVILFTDGIANSSWYNKTGPNETTEHNVHTRAAYGAGQELHSLAKVFTVGLFGGIENEAVKAIAEDTLIQAQNAGYYFADAPTDLTDIYNKIYESMAYYAANTVITDQIDERFELVEGSIVTKINDEVVDSSASYDEKTRTITWAPGNLKTSATLSYSLKAKDTFFGGDNIPTNTFATIEYTDVDGTPSQTLTFPVPTVTVPELVKVQAFDKTIVIGEQVNLGEQVVITGGTAPYTYSWTWEDGSSAEKDTSVSPDRDTQYTVTVTDSYNYSASASFWIYVKKGTVIIHKDVNNVNSDPRIFSLHMKGGPSNANWNILAQDDKAYTISNLKPGTYTISETLPLDYELVNISPSTISFKREDILRSEESKYTRHVYVTNRKIDVPYFWNTAFVQNVFQTSTNFE